MTGPDQTDSGMPTKIRRLLAVLGVAPVAFACTSADQVRALSVAECVVPKVDALPAEARDVTVGQIQDLLDCRKALKRGELQPLPEAE